ncbi:hypothetical protein WAI453_001583 [Rhynchosporium graminicola]
MAIAMQEAFVKLDGSIFKTAIDAYQTNLPLQDKLANMAPAFAGSCALLSLYDPEKNKVHVACTGDSRAVYGQQNDQGVWEAIPMSIDQSGYNEAEIARLKKEHPGEDEQIFSGGRILGIMISRAYGDSRWKWPVELQEDLKKRSGGPSRLGPKYKVLTPPYLTAEPVVKSLNINPGKPSFLIMATDGLWDKLSQQAVDLVSKWLKTPTTSRTESNIALEMTYEPYDFSGPESSERFVKEKMTVQDSNAAVHLVGNSLGGNHHEMIAGRLAYGSPFSRDVRDDITVQVIFFHVPEQ